VRKKQKNIKVKKSGRALAKILTLKRKPTTCVCAEEATISMLGVTFVGHGHQQQLAALSWHVSRRSIMKKLKVSRKFACEQKKMHCSKVESGEEAPPWNKLQREECWQAMHLEPLLGPKWEQLMMPISQSGTH